MPDDERPGGGGNHGEIIARLARRRHARDGPGLIEWALSSRLVGRGVWVWPINESVRGPDQPGLSGLSLVSSASAWVPIPLSCPRSTAM
jgi:hypothetical protein